MGDLIVVAGALFGLLLIAAGIGWFVPGLRRRFAGQRTGAAAGSLPGVGLVLAGVIVVALSMGVLDEGAAASASGDLAATCGLFDEMSGEDDITVERLDRLIAVAPDSTIASIRTVRDRLVAVGPAAFDEPAVGAAFESVGAFEEAECSK
jgi:hypothetical protein